MISAERPDAPSVTEQLHEWRDGSDAAFAAVVEQLYPELKKIAARRLGHSGNATLTPTELLHEALLQALPAPADFRSRAHFIATMSLAIRSILIDHARARVAHKRGGGALRVTLNGVEPGDDSMVVDLLAIEQALTQLEQLDPRCGRVMHLTYFAGLARAEIAELLEVSLPTVDRDLKFARAWLNQALQDGR